MPETLQYNGEVRYSLICFVVWMMLMVLLQFLIPWARLGRCREEAYDEELGKKLWNWLEEQVKDV